jgi:hypothetical protein
MNNIKKNNDQYHSKCGYRLRTQYEEQIYAPPTNRFTFYQICRFPMDKQHKVRKHTINEVGDIIDTIESTAPTKKVEKFMKSQPSNKYMIYASYNFDSVQMPTYEEISLAMSSILNE